MLLGTSSLQVGVWTDDVQTDDTLPDCLLFDRQVLLLGELHIAGAIAFAARFGFDGHTLIEWALYDDIADRWSESEEATTNVKPRRSRPARSPRR